MPSLGIGLGIHKVRPLAAKLLLDRVPGADLLYMPSLQLSRKIKNSVELRRTSDNAEQEFTPKQWQQSDVVAFSEGPEREWQNISGFTNLSSDGLSGFTATHTTGTSSIAQSLPAFSAKVGDTYALTFNYSGPSVRLLLRVGASANRSQILTLVQGANTVLLTLSTSDSEDVRVTFFVPNDSASGTVSVTNFSVTPTLAANARATKTYDWSGNGRTGTQTTAAAQPFAVTGGVLEEGLRFAGGQFIRTIPSNEIQSGFTLACWVRPSAITASASGRYRIFTRSDGAVSRGYLSIDNSQFAAMVNNASAPEMRSANIAINEWYFVVVEWVNGANRLFVDNVATAVATSTASLGQANTEPVNIGAGAGASPPTIFYEGLLSFLGGWSRTLTADEKAIVKNLTDPR